MANNHTTSIDCWFGPAFLDLCLSVPVSTGVIGRIRRLRSGFPFDSGPNHRLEEVLGPFWRLDSTDQHKLATAELDSIPLTSSATTGQMVVIGTMRPLDTAFFLLFAPTAARRGFPLSPPLVAGLNTLPNSLGAVSHWLAGPPALLSESCLSTHANRRSSAR